MPYADPEARRAYAREYHLKNKAKKNAYAREWYHANPEKIKEQRKKWYAKNQTTIIAYRKKNKEAIAAYDKERSIRRNCFKYGLDPAKLPRPLVCELCGASGVRMAFDHDHDTEKFRGILCTHCNVAIGMAKDNPNLLEKMAKYLRDHK